MPDHDVDVLLVGGGVAAVRCARALRRERYEGSILLVGDEASLPYNRPPLSKELLRDDLPDELVLAEPATWYERRGIDLVVGQAVVTLDTERHIAVLSDGRNIRFRQCVLATGAEARPLAVPGGGRAMLVRTLADARALRAAARAAGQGASAVVVGGGFIGVEIASGLAAVGLRPTILERSATLWAGRLGSTVAAWAGQALRDAGVTVRTGVEVTRIDDEAVWIGSERLPASLVAAGVGAVPRDGLAAEAGLVTQRGIEVDAAGRTSDPSVWAAGDVARRAGRTFEHWHGAREAGERAARSMLGLDVVAPPVEWVFTEVAGTALDALGVAGPDAVEHPVEEGIVAFVEGRAVVQLVVVGGVLRPDLARGLVAASASVEEVARAAAGTTPSR